MDTTFGMFAKLFTMIDLGMADSDMVALASQWYSTWEEHEHLYHKLIPILDNLVQEIP